MSSEELIEVQLTHPTRGTMLVRDDSEKAFDAVLLAALFDRGTIPRMSEANLEIEIQAAQMTIWDVLDNRMLAQARF